MKIKYSVNVLLILFLIGFTGCNDDDNQNGADQLPATARAFIDNRLSGCAILNIEEVDDNGNESNEKYVVTLSNDIVATFSSLGYWRRIESGSELPEKVQGELLYDGAKKVKAKYPSRTINKMYFLPFFQKVVLNDDTGLIVYSDNSSKIKIGVDMHDKLAMNQKIYDFVRYYYAESGVPRRTYEFFREDESDGSGYRFYVNGKAASYFDKDGNWYYADGGGYSIYGNMYQQILPQELRDIVENKYKGTSSSVHRIIYHGAYYQVLLKTVVGGTSPFFILYDTTTKAEMEPPTQTVFDFMKTYLRDPNPALTFTATITLDSVKDIIYEFTGLLDDAKVMVMYMGLNGHMYGMSLKGTEIPRKVLDYLPSKVKEFVEKNISAEDVIVSVINGMNDEYYILFKHSGKVDFDKDGNII